MSRKVAWGAGCALAAALTAPPALAQRRTHGAGVSWSGGHGGVSWDGNHAYEGGSYGGYPATSAPKPVYRKSPVLPYLVENTVASKVSDLARANAALRADRHRPIGVAQGR